MDTVYLVTYKDENDNTEGERHVKECTTMKEAISCILALGNTGAYEVELFRAQAVTA